MIFEAKSQNVTVNFTNIIEIISTELPNKAVNGLFYSTYPLFQWAIPGEI